MHLNDSTEVFIFFFYFFFGLVYDWLYDFNIWVHTMVFINLFVILVTIMHICEKYTRPTLLRLLSMILMNVLMILTVIYNNFKWDVW